MSLLGIFFLSLLVMMALGFPIYLCLIGSSMIYIFLNPNLTMLTALEKMMNATNSFALLAVPFFIFAGNIMNTGSISERIFDFAQKLVGRFKGGLGYVNIVASTIFSGASGSALADIGGLGTIEIKAMRERKFDDRFTIGVTGASSVVGPIIPPSIPFVLYGSMANVSIGGLFFGGIVPGLMISGILMIFVYILAKKYNLPAEPAPTLGQMFTSFRRAFWALCFPLIIIGGIWTGYFTPTEAAFVSILYGFLISVVFYRDLKLKEVPRMVVETVRTTVPATAVVIGAALFGWILSYEKVDRFVIDFIFSITDNKYLILLLVNLLLFVLGMFVDVVAAILITLPILLPLTSAVGVDPIHLGVILVLNLMIGLLTPPVGMSLYMLSSVAKIPFGQVVRIMLPWLVPLIIALMIVTYVPQVVLFLPNLLGIY